jgi:hypothetical protein
MSSPSEASKLLSMLSHRYVPDTREYYYNSNRHRGSYARRSSKLGPKATLEETAAVQASSHLDFGKSGTRNRAA